MKVGVFAACVVLAFQVRPGFAADDQSQASPLATPKKESTAKSKQASRASKTPAWEEGPKQNSLGLPLLKNIARDQKAIWTSPSRLRFRDATWLVPLAGVTAGLMATDQDVSKHFSNSPDTLKRYRRLSDAGALSLVGAAGGLYLWGKATHDDHKRETGLLSGEALLNSFMLTSAIQYSAGRERPYQNGAQGRFFQRGTSFPSNHSAAAWSVASVIAHEYPGPLTKVLAYGLASAVSFSRVKSKQHFPADVVVGGLIGWFVGKQVYREHHDPMLGGGIWQDFTDAGDSEPGQSSKNAGSPYVPLDSWVYPAFERLAALRYVTSDFRGLKPWTRTECARLTDEADEAITGTLREDHNPSENAVKLLHALEKEFAAELDVLGGARHRSFNMESVYARVMSLSGPILNDSYHFGQTIANDDGRPFRRGTNVVSGAALRASYGPFFAYAWGEYQHAPSAPALSNSQRQLIAQVDDVPLPSGLPFAPVNRFRLLDTYVGVNIKNWQVSFGRQSLWWGTSESGPMIFSNNAEPLNMVRLNRVVPFRLPSFLGVFGPIRVDFFVGRAGGHTIAARPWLQGQRLSFKMTRDFEFGFTHSAMFGGKGRPNGIDVFFKTLVPVLETIREFDTGVSLSDQHISFDFQYRFGRAMTFYAEMMNGDNREPFTTISRTAVNTGLYFPHLPKFSRLDLRLEGVYTDTPDTTQTPHKDRLNYWHFIYKQGHTNNGVILGNSVGRAGVGYQGWLTYWISHQERLQFNFKRTIVSTTFIPNGGYWSDYSIRYEKDLNSGFVLRSFLQLERLRYPFLFPDHRSNVTAQMELRYSLERRTN